MRLENHRSKPIKPKRLSDVNWAAWKPVSGANPGAGKIVAETGGVRKLR